METILEQQRRLHEERDRLEDAMTNDMLQKINKKSTVSSTKKNKIFGKQY